MTTSEIIEYVIVWAVLVIAVAVAARAIYRALRCNKRTDVACAGCPFALTCSRQNHNN